RFDTASSADRHVDAERIALGVSCVRGAQDVRPWGRPWDFTFSRNRSHRGRPFAHRDDRFAYLAALGERRGPRRPCLPGLGLEGPPNVLPGTWTCASDQAFGAHFSHLLGFDR